MATIRPQSYRTIATRILKENILEIASKLEAGHHNCPDYKDYTNEQLTRKMLESIIDGSVDSDLDFEVVRQIFLDYALKNKMSLANAKQIVNISLGSSNGDYISSTQSYLESSLDSGNYYLTAFDTLNKIIKSLKSLGVGPDD